MADIEFTDTELDTIGAKAERYDFALVVRLVAALRSERTQNLAAGAALQAIADDCDGCRGQGRRLVWITATHHDGYEPCPDCRIVRRALAARAALSTGESKA